MAFGRMANSRTTATDRVTDRRSVETAVTPAIVLVRPQLGENIGMAARAMANFGLSDLRLVAPRDGWPNDKALSAASGASAIVEVARVFDRLEDAIADLHVVFATTARERGQGKRVIGPEEAMGEAASGSSDVRHGVLFGPERTGLDGEEIALASAVVTFPVEPGFSSLNLSQAVLLVGYEWFRIARSGALPFNTPAFSRPASREDLVSFFEFLEQALDQSGYFTPAPKRANMWRNLRNIVHRIDATEQDLRTLRSMVVALARERRKADPQ